MILTEQIYHQMILDFRTGASGRANSVLTDVFSLLESQLPGLDKAIVASLMPHLACMQTFQQSRDWVGVADVLEYQLLSLMHTCGIITPTQ